jgi:integrase/recombinase XerD
MPQVVALRDLTAYLRPEQVEKLMAVAHNPRDRLLVRIPWYTGIRVTELINIRVPHIDFENRTIRIRKQKERKQDGKVMKTQRIVPVDSGTLDMIKEYLQWRKQYPYRGDFLFPITRRRVNQIYWELARRAGIDQVGDPEMTKHLKVHPHTLRHSFAIHSVKHGLSLAELQKILGHKNLSTTMVYLQVSGPDLHEGYDKIWERDANQEQTAKAGAGPAAT